MTFNPLKEFIAPKYVVGLTVDSGFISAVRVYRALNALEIDHAAVRKVEDPERISEELRDFFQKENLGNDALVTCLPTSRAFVRLLPLRFRDFKKLEKIIKYQMEPYVPHPVDDLVVDFLAPKEDGDIVTAGVPKGVLSEHLQSLARAGLEPQVVGLDDVGLFFLYLLCRPEISEQGVSIIHTDPSKTVVQIIRENRMEFIRVLPGGTGGIEELAETFSLYRLKNPDTEIGEILLTGDSGDDGKTAETIRSRVNVKTSLWRPFDEIKNGLGEMPPELQSRLSVPLGLAVSLTETPTKGFDLRKDEFAVRSSVTPRRVSFYALTVLILLGLFTSNLYYKLSIHENHERALQQNMRQTFLRTFPDAKNIIKGRELDQMRQRIEEESGKVRWLEHMSGKATVLHVLKVISESLVGFTDVTLDNISIEGKEIRLDGRASSFETVDKLEKKLLGMGFFNTIKLVGAKMDKKAQAVTFNFAAERRL